MGTPTENIQPCKKMKTMEGTPLSALPFDKSGEGKSSGTAPKAGSPPELFAREQNWVTVEVNPLYLRYLKDQKILGYRRPFGKTVLNLVTYEINVAEFRRCLNHCFRKALLIRYYSDYTHSTRRQAEIEAESTEIADLTAEICMSALYAELRRIPK